MKCPKCSSNNKTKAGFIKEKQRYKCRECGCYFTVEYKSTAKSQYFKRQALHLYLEGLNYREIGNVLGVSNVSIMKWMKSYGEGILKIHNETEKAGIKDVIDTKKYIDERSNNKSAGLLIIDIGKERKRSYVCKTFWAEFAKKISLISIYLVNIMVINYITTLYQ